jgi:hypothetical protein
MANSAMLFTEKTAMGGMQSTKRSAPSGLAHRQGKHRCRSALKDIQAREQDDWGWTSPGTEQDQCEKLSFVSCKTNALQVMKRNVDVLQWHHDLHEHLEADGDEDRMERNCRCCKSAFSPSACKCAEILREWWWGQLVWQFLSSLLLPLRNEVFHC